MGESRRRQQAGTVETGGLDILNVGCGHLTVSFSKANRPELERAKRMITDMLRRGYAIFVDVDGQLEPVRGFDPDREVYLIDEAPQSAVDAPIEALAVPESKPARAFRESDHGAGKHRRRKVSIETSRATAVGRSAGG